MIQDGGKKQDRPVEPEEIQIQSTDVTLLNEEENKGLGYDIIAANF